MLTVLELLKTQIKDGRDTFESTVADLKPEHLAKDPGGKAFPIGSTYAHLIFSEDMIIQGMLQDKAPLSASSWKDKTGASSPMPAFDENWEQANHDWSKTVMINLDQLRSYSKAVYAATDEYVQSLKEEDLEKEIDLGPMGKRTLVNILSNFIIHHACSLAGEISVLKGLQGLKGYPF